MIGASARCERLLALLPALVAGLGEPQAADENAAAQEKVLDLTLADAVRIALENNLELETERLATEIALADSLGSFGAFDPVLSLSGSLNDRESPPTDDFAGAAIVETDTQSASGSLLLPFRTGGSLELSYDRSNFRTNSRFATFDISTSDVVSLAVNQPLLRGGWTRFATVDQRESEIDFRRQREREREVRQRVLLEVYDAYWDLVSAREELAVRELAVELGERQLDQDRRRLEVGVGTEVDVLQSETNVAQREESRIEAEYALRAAEDALRKLLFQKAKGPEEEGADRLDEWDWPVVPRTALPELGDEPAPALDWRASLARAIEARPELWGARAEIEAAAVRLERARSSRLPQLDLDLSASGTGFDTDPSEAYGEAIGFEFLATEAGLTFSLPLWNRSGRNAVRSGRAALRSARIAYERAELDILGEVRAAVRGVHHRSQSVEAAEKSRLLAERQLAAEEARQEIGLSTTFQVLEFQQDLAEALSAERAARSAYAKAVAALGKAEGRIPEAPRTGLEALEPPAE